VRRPAPARVPVPACRSRPRSRGDTDCTRGRPAGFAKRRPPRARSRLDRSGRAIARRASPPAQPGAADRYRPRSRDDSTQTTRPGPGGSESRARVRPNRTTARRPRARFGLRRAKDRAKRDSEDLYRPPGDAQPPRSSRPGNACRASTHSFQGESRPQPHAPRGPRPFEYGRRPGAATGGPQAQTEHPETGRATRCARSGRASVPAAATAGSRAGARIRGRTAARRRREPALRKAATGHSTSRWNESRSPDRSVLGAAAG